MKRITNPLADKPRRRNSNYVEMQRLKRLSGRCFGQQIRCWSKKRGTSPKKKAVSATTEHLQVAIANKLMINILIHFSCFFPGFAWNFTSL